MRLLGIACALMAQLSAAKPKGVRGRVTTIPSSPVLGTVDAQFLSNLSGLDGPKLSAINGTVFEWWYFDVVSHDLKSSIALTFFTDTASGFPFSIRPSTDVTTVAISGTYPNGTLFAKQLDADKAIISTVGDGSSGLWTGNDSSGWIGTSDLSRYVVKIKAPGAGVIGCLSLKSIAPPHYPCGPAQAGENMELAPHLGWSNAVTDAEAYVEVIVDGEAFSFSGSGYHDKVFTLLHFLFLRVSIVHLLISPLFIRIGVTNPFSTASAAGFGVMAASVPIRSSFLIS